MSRELPITAREAWETDFSTATPLQYRYIYGKAGARIGKATVRETVAFG
jgi:hypothetical protein